jgi:hypothetical protein
MLAIGSPVSLFQLAYSKNAYLMIMKLLYISEIRIIGFEQRFRERLALLCSVQSIAPLFKAAVFNMLLVAEIANSDSPSIGFCNEPLIGWLGLLCVYLWL